MEYISKPRYSLLRLVFTAIPLRRLFLLPQSVLEVLH